MTEYEKMTEFLETRLENIVSCLYVVDGKMHGIKGRLTEVNDQYIAIDDRRIGFVEDNGAIYAIFEKNNNVLYRNEAALVMSNMLVSSYSAPKEVLDEAVVEEKAEAQVEAMRPSEEEFSEMFGALEASVGKQVTIEYIYKGELSHLNGNLDSVVPYDCITIDSQMIPFIGPYDGIVSVMGPEGLDLYRNEMVRNYHGCKMEDQFAIFEAQEHFLGKSLAHEDYLHKNDDTPAK